MPRVANKVRRRLIFDVQSALPGDALRSLQLRLWYRWRLGQWPRLVRPRLFTEWVQHRKLHDRDPRLPRLADKVLAKQWVAQLAGDEAVTPTLWQGRALPDRPVTAFPYVVKARHGCGHWALVRNAAEHRIARAASERWTRKAYGGLLGEWLYGEIERGLLVEPYLGEGDLLPIDYKFFVFGGSATHVQVHLGRNDRHRWIVMSRDWRRISGASGDPDPPAPDALPAMLAMAERLGANFPFVRVDLYDIGGRPRFGELTFYPGSGLMRIDPPELDGEWGRAWSAARAASLEGSFH